MAAKGDDIVSMVGARRRDRLAEALGALNVTTLTAAQLARLTEASHPGLPPASCYPQSQLTHIDFERRPTA